MKSDKEVKREFKIKAGKSPDDYYATSVLREKGYIRKKCRVCGTFFWTVNPGQEVCGDPACSGGFRFIGDSPAKKKLSYIEVWKEFSAMFKKLGYTPIKRYPVVARWRADTDFVQASIYDFQPYVVKGEIDPPANPLVVPQFSLRFNDIDNVGITGAHYTGFVMIGQHAFMKPEEWDQEKYFSDIYTWLSRGLGLPDSEIIFHEDAWAGGGNFGPCMEYFSRGLELGNQVYMLYERTANSYKNLNLRVLDMGMGHERNAWFTNATSTSYETTFPTVVKHLMKATGIRSNPSLIKRFLPYASYLNMDEVDNIDKAWARVASSVGIGVDELRREVIPLSALFSIAEHSRSLLVALSDGALPSNVGGGYNLRVIFRRALSFIDKYNWDVDFMKLMELHAAYLKPLFPELSEHLDDVNEIIEHEKLKYRNTKEKTAKILSKISSGVIEEKELLRLYDSQGIAPELVKQEAEKKGKTVRIPENFYSMVTELHEKKEEAHATRVGEVVELDSVPATEALYFDDYKLGEFKAGVIRVEGPFVVLDRTAFYPTSGGQLHDTGAINGIKVLKVFKQGGVIVHKVDKENAFREGEHVVGVVDIERRIQLAQHHTATHIVNAAARIVLGDHVNQAGAKKDVDKAHLDITHYRSLSNEEIKRIEEEANKIVRKAIPVEKSFYSRDEAERLFGMRIYQGGAVPGKRLRIVKIDNLDVEACGGTHVDNTSEVGKIRIIRSTKIQDGIVRLFFTAGKATERFESSKSRSISELAGFLGVPDDRLFNAVKELFSRWKRVRKALRKGQGVPASCFEAKEVGPDNLGSEEAIEHISEFLRTPKGDIIKSVRKFHSELGRMKAQLEEKGLIKDDGQC